MDLQLLERMFMVWSVLWSVVWSMVWSVVWSVLWSVLWSVWFVLGVMVWIVSWLGHTENFPATDAAVTSLQGHVTAWKTLQHLTRAEQVKQVDLCCHLVVNRFTADEDVRTETRKQLQKLDLSPDPLLLEVLVFSMDPDSSFVQTRKWADDLRDLEASKETKKSSLHFGPRPFRVGIRLKLTTGTTTAQQMMLESVDSGLMTKCFHWTLNVFFCEFPQGQDSTSTRAEQHQQLVKSGSGCYEIRSSSSTIIIIIIIFLLIIVTCLLLHL
ncbi:uncharacterized protein V6R79_024910 [Siganus canaliculatus]